MALTKEKKEEILKELKELVKDAGIVIFVNFHGLTSVLARELRVLMAQANAKYFVAKKTLAKKVFNELEISGEMPEMEGELALVFGSSEITLPTKSLLKFSKGNAGIGLQGGIFEKGFINKETVLKLASLPSREVLIWQFINVINAPKSRLVGVLQAPIRDFVSVLGQISK